MADLELSKNARLDKNPEIETRVDIDMLDTTTGGASNFSAISVEEIRNGAAQFGIETSPTQVSFGERTQDQVVAKGVEEALEQFKANHQKGYAEVEKAVLASLESGASVGSIARIAKVCGEEALAKRIASIPQRHQEKVQQQEAERQRQKEKPEIIESAVLDKIDKLLESDLVSDKARDGVKLRIAKIKATSVSKAQGYIERAEAAGLDKKEKILAAATQFRLEKYDELSTYLEHKIGRAEERSNMDTADLSGELMDTTGQLEQAADRMDSSLDLLNTDVRDVVASLRDRFRKM